MNVLFDTDAIIEYLRGNTDVMDYITSIGGEKNIIISAISYAEVLLFAKDKRHFNRLKKNLEELILLDVNDNVSELFRKYMDRYSLSHRPSLPDMFNAAFAKYYDVEFFTLNLSDFTFIYDLNPHCNAR